MEKGASSFLSISFLFFKQNTLNEEKLFHVENKLSIYCQLSSLKKVARHQMCFYFCCFQEKSVFFTLLFFTQT